MSALPIILTNGQLAEVHAGLSALDGLQTKDGFVPFKYALDTVWLIASNTTIIAEKLKVLNAANRALLNQFGFKQGSKVVTPEEISRAHELNEAMNQLVEKAIPVEGIEKLSKAALDVGKNPIPAGVLAKLMVILE